MRYYGELPVNVVRVWSAIVGVEEVQFVDLKVIGTGKSIEGVRADTLTDVPFTKKHKIVFVKGNKKQKFIWDSPEYKKFVYDNKLNETMIQNCIKGVVKTHQGYTITEEK